MKKYFLYTLFLLKITTLFSQDIVNPYKNYTVLSNGNNPIDYPFTVKIGSATYSNVETFQYVIAGPYYNGEFEIALDKHLWNNFPDHAKSYTYEVVSFPFMNDCAFTYSGCVSTNPDRNFFLPSPETSIYDGGNKYWDVNNFYTKMYNQTPVRPFINRYSGGPLKISSAVATTLVSQLFYASDPNGTNTIPTRMYLPHSIIKVTINLHCGNNSETDPIVDSHSFVYDNTRGRMRFYPFYPNNSGQNPQIALHDVIFVPKLILNSEADQDYDETLPANSVMPDGALNYFPLSENSTNGCNSLQEPIPYLAYNPDTYVFPPPYTVYSNSLRSHNGKYLAGYDIYFSGNLEVLPGIKHIYNIDQNLDLSILNPSDKVIYNPSEVNVFANNFIFPTGYSFKTTRGVYPNPTNVEIDNISDNGGPYSDPRIVPVRTDLRSENTSDPQDPLNPKHSVYASRYYLKSGSQITVQPCVQIYDATFDVAQGATLIFLDNTQMLGKEDKSNYTGRYKIKGLGGAILRNSDAIQYVQNGIISQPQPLVYTASDKIIAGYDVDPNTDQPQGNYQLMATSDVTFQANNEVELTNGFSSSEGSSFSAYCAPIPIYPICPDPSGRHSGQRFVSKELSKSFEDKSSSLVLSPNPSNGKFKVLNPSLYVGCRVIITDALGRIVYTNDFIAQNEFKIDLSGQPKGIYFALISQGENEFRKKIIIQ
jgi:hypothetical protein